MLEIIRLYHYLCSLFYSLVLVEYLHRNSFFQQIHRIFLIFIIVMFIPLGALHTISTKIGGDWNQCHHLQSKEKQRSCCQRVDLSFWCENILSMYKYISYDGFECMWPFERCWVFRLVFFIVKCVSTLRCERKNEMCLHLKYCEIMHEISRRRKNSMLSLHASYCCTVEFV